MKAISSTFGTELAAAGLAGLAFSWQPDGTILYGPTLTSDQISAIETVYANHDPIIGENQQTAISTYNTTVAAGLTITSTSSAITTSTISLSPTQQTNLANVSLYIAVNSKFPGGLPGLSLTTVSGTLVAIPSTTTWQQIATATADYIALCDVALLTASAGGTASWPSSSVTIA